MSPRTRPLTADEALLLTADTEPYLSCDDCFEQVGPGRKRSCPTSRSRSHPRSGRT